MAKKHKKRRKITRREQTAAAAKATPKAKNPIPPSNDEVLPDPPAKEVRGPVKVAFTRAESRGPDGIDAALAEQEYPAVRRDLRKLGLTIVTFALLLTALKLTADNTQIINQLGDALFRLWS